MFASALAYFAGLNHWQLGLLATALLWQGALVSPFPEEVIVLTLGIFWGQGRITFGEALFFNCLGLIPSNMVPLVLGKFFGLKLLTRRPLSWMFDAQAVDQSLARIESKTDWIIFVTRFTPFLRGPIYFAAGLAKMSLMRFVVIDLLAALLQVSAIQWAGMKMGENAESLWVLYQRIGIVMAILLAGGIVWGYLRKNLKARTA